MSRACIAAAAATTRLQLHVFKKACNNKWLQVYVLRDYYLSVLSLEWRAWMTDQFTQDYFKDRTFYHVQAGTLVDNPDQRIANDVRYAWYLATKHSCNQIIPFWPHLSTWWSSAD